MYFNTNYVHLWMTITYYDFILSASTMLAGDNTKKSRRRLWKLLTYFLWWIGFVLKSSKMLRALRNSYSGVCLRFSCSFQALAIRFVTVPAVYHAYGLSLVSFQVVRYCQGFNTQQNLENRQSAGIPHASAGATPHPLHFKNNLGSFVPISKPSS